MTLDVRRQHALIEPEIGPGMKPSEFREIYRPANMIEVGLIQSVLDAEGIQYHINNMGAHSIGGSPPAICAEEMRLVVDRQRADEAIGLVQDVLHIKIL